MLFAGQVGQQTVKDGQNPTVRVGTTGEVIMSELHGKYYETTVRGNMFSLDSGAQTMAAATVTGAAAGTAKFLNGIYNPMGSGKLAAIVMSRVVNISGTPGTYYSYNAQSGILTTTSAATGTIQSGLIGSTTTSAMTPLVMVVLSNGGGTAAMQQFAIQGGPGNLSSGTTNLCSDDMVDGRIIVPPGCLFGLMVGSAGTTWVLQSTLFWEEIPL